MADIFLPSVNFNNSPGFGEFEFLHKIYSEEFFLRSLISCNPGIVDRSGDPASTPFDTTRPLFVSINEADPLTVDVTPGYAITPNHRLIEVDGSLSNLPLPDIAADQVYIVAVEYTLIPSEQKRVTRFNIPAEVRSERPSQDPYGDEVSNLSQAVVIVNINDFFNPTLFDEERKKYLVVLAVITTRASSVTGQISLEIDYTRNTYDFNRPWFSIEDTEHRSKIGSGQVTDNNPHGTELQDLSSAGFTLYQQLIPRGGVYSKDLVYYGYPGQYCQELVTINRYQVDDTGVITGDPESQLEVLRGRFFVTLTKVPVRVGSLYFQGEPWEPIPYYWKPGTRYLILDTLEEPLLYGKALMFEYFAVNALQPPAESLTQGVQTFEVGVPTTDQDYIISGGLALSELAQTSVSLTTLAGPIKKSYNLLCNSDGTLLLSPQPLVPILKVTDILATTIVAINQAPLNGYAVRLTVGLTRAVESLNPSPGFELNLKLRLTGLNGDGSIIQEDITFKASQWKEQGTANVEEPLQFRQTKQTFASLTQVQILNTTNDPDNAGSEAVISIWANIDEAKQIGELANSASFFWTGTTGIRVKDKRLISSTVQRADQRKERFPQLLPENDAAFSQEFFSVILDPPLTDPRNHSKRLALELDDDRYFGETWRIFSTADASGKVQVIDFSRVTPGMTLRVADGKVLTFVSGSADPTIGEVLIPVSLLTGDVEIKNNITTTLNDPTFDSTWFAEAGNTDITLSRAQSYIDGFAVSQKKKMVFASAFTAGFIDFDVNGVSIATVASTGAHDSSLDDIVTAVNDIADVTGVTAVRVVESPISVIFFNGNSNGDEFTVSTPIITGAINSAGITTPDPAFILTQPSGGILPTAHLPQRFLSDEKEWNYLTRAIPWVGVGLQAEIAFSNTTNIQNLDQLEVASGKILIARKGSPAPSITRGAGEFLVTSLLDTLISAATTINDPSYASGLKAQVPKLTPFGIAEVNTLTDTFDIPFHLFKDDDPVIFTTDDTLPIGLSDSVTYYVVNANQNAFQVSLTVGGPAVVLGTTGSGNHLIGLPKVLVDIGGYSGAAMTLVVEGIPGTWLIQDYQPVGVGDLSSTGFVKTLHPPRIIEWRYQVVAPDLNVPYGPNNWSPWSSLLPVSPTAYKFAGPVGHSLYCIQLRIAGPSGKPNAFSLYQLSPEVSGATTQALDIRLTDTETEIDNARGTLPDLNTRISSVVDVNGVPVKDTELSDARDSTILSPQGTLKNRLDIADGLSYWLHGTVDNYLKPTAMGNLGIPNQILSGITDINGNSNFLTAGTSILTVNATPANPLVLSMNGNYYRYARNFTVDFSALPADTEPYYLYSEIPTGGDLGTLLFSGTITSIASAGSQILDTSVNFGSLITDLINTQGTPVILRLPSIPVGTESFYAPVVDTPASNQVEIFGEVPSLVPIGTPFELYSFREMPFAVSLIRPAASDLKKLTLGQVVWDGFNLSGLRTYRYLDRYKSDIRGAPNPTPITVAGTMTPIVFDHNLGKLPTNWTLLYHSVATGDAEPSVINAEIICKVTENQLTVVNRYDSVLARVFGTPPTATATGFLQLII